MSRHISVVVALVVLTASVRAQSVPDGLSAKDWSSIRAAYEASRYRVVTAADGWRAHNPGQGWTTSFDDRGFTTTSDAGGWSWGLELVRYGWDDPSIAVDLSPSVSVDGGRLARDWDGRLTEWYVNDPRGLEHGFTVRERPSDASAALTLEVSIRGGSRPVVSTDGRVVRFEEARGVIALNYGGLTVLDAEGHELPARWTSAEGDRLRLLVDDDGARYPLTIDPIAQQAYVKVYDPNAHDFFGASVAVVGDTVVVGAYGEDSNATGVNGDDTDNSAPNAGAAYVFVRNSASWSLQAYLKASNAGTGDQFGRSVAMWGDTVVVGASLEDSNAKGVNGNEANNTALSSGAAYVFVRNGTVWTQQAYLKASNTGAGDGFGWSVAISGDTIVVAASGEASNAVGVNGNQANNDAILSGAAYVFLRSGTSWSQQAYLKASNTDAYDYFGSSVAISGDTIVVGASAEDSNATGVNGSQTSNSATQAGAAYVFVRNGAIWSQQAYLKAPNTDIWDSFGVSVAVSGDTIVVGVPNEDSNATGVNGDRTDNSALSSGAVHVYVRSALVWSQEAYLKASNTGAGDAFGYSVAILGDTVLVGARGEASNATGVNGDQFDDSAINAGAAYLFVRSGTSWSQQAYLKASNTDGGDWFGYSVALSGDTIVVGAFDEDSATTAVNGDQADNSASQSGAAYVFDVCPTIATAATYGVGKAGTLGVPVLSTTKPPKIGATHGLVLSGGLPSAFPVLLFAGFAPASLPFDGGTLLVTPSLTVMLPPLDASGGFALPVTLTAWTCGLAFYMQVMFVDPGAADFYQTAQTNGVVLTIGA